MGQLARDSFHHHATLYRLTFFFNATDAKIHHVADPELAVQAQWAMLAVEINYQLTRRIMIQCMDNRNSTVIAIALVSLEEAILRGTFVERDAWFRRLRKQPPLSKMSKRSAEILRRESSASNFLDYF